MNRDVPPSKVLVVDDDPIFQTLLRRALPPMMPEQRFLFASSGVDALELVRREPIDLLLTDLYMPGGDGFSLVPTVLDEQPWVTVCVMTAQHEPGLDAQFSEGGLVPCLRKPLDIEQLSNTLRGLLMRSARGQLRGLTTFSLLWLLEVEKKTSRLLVFSRESSSRAIIDVVKGELWSAAGPGGEGLDFLHEVLAWEDVSLSIEPLPRVGRRSVFDPMQRVLNEAARRLKSAQKNRAGSSSDLSAAIVAHRWRRTQGGRSSSLAYLTELAAEGQSGELVACGDGVEAHAHLQDGKVVWCTSSSSQQTFLDRLVAAGHSAQDLHEAVRECRRGNLPLTETLLEWELVSHEDLTAAFLDQFVDALEALRTVRRRDAVFLRRSAQNARALSFGLAEIVARMRPAEEDEDDEPSESAPPQQQPSKQPSARAASVEGALGVVVPGVPRVPSVAADGAAGAASEVLASLRACSERVSWVQVTRRGETLGSAGQPVEPGVENAHRALVERYRSRNVHFVGLRAEHAAAGRAMDDDSGRVVWTACGADDYSVVVMAMVRVFALPASARGGPNTDVIAGELSRVGADPSGPVAAVLAQLFERAASLVSARFDATDPSLSVEVVRGLGDAPSGWQSHINEWADVVPARGVGDAAQRKLEGLAVLDDEGWWFFRRLANGRGSVALHFTTGTPQGAGWTLLARLGNLLDVT